ncbi:M48 family metallopeptidase [Undibacterium sp. Ji67W]|uniref:M48 family metallopeptidase n=1 Tax=Undibacterium sp. Ji67W TaxID=3413042 RepID=UPI003BF19EC3
MKFVSPTIKSWVLSGLFVCSVVSAPFSVAQDAPRDDGVKVGGMSWARNFVPKGALEQQAAMQYAQIIQQAQQARALGPDDFPQVVRLRTIANKLIPYTLSWNARSRNWKWEVNLLASKQVNAYCMPGGKIAFYSGILDTLKLTDDEVAIVMGHEIAHALREHGAEREGKARIANFGVQLAEIFAGLKGYDTRVAGAAAGTLAKVGMLAFSRQDETEADIVGLDIAARAGYDPRAGIVLWQKMGMINKSAPPQWLSTHPAGNNRIAEIQKHLPEVMPLYAKVHGFNVNQLGPYRPNVKGIEPVTYP